MTTPPAGGPPFGSGPYDPPTQRIPHAGPRPDPRHGPEPEPGYSQPTARLPKPPPPPQGEPAEPRRRGLRGDPLSVILALVIVGALGLAALLGGEMYARHKADSIVAKAVSCVVRDSATASFGLRPFLLQHLTHSYRDMRVETAGNQIREAKGMKLSLRLDDVRMNPTAESAGTLGALDADITWTADGIKDTVSGMIPLIGSLVSGVTTDPSSGTLEVVGPLGTVTIKPEAVDGALKLDALRVTGLGMTLPRESVQPALDLFTDQLTSNLPMGIHAESVEVTGNGVAARFATRNATIPNGQQDPCFTGL